MSVLYIPLSNGREISPEKAPSNLNVVCFYVLFLFSGISNAVVIAISIGASVMSVVILFQAALIVYLIK